MIDVHPRAGTRPAHDAHQDEKPGTDPVESHRQRLARAPFAGPSSFGSDAVVAEQGQPARPTGDERRLSGRASTTWLSAAVVPIVHRVRAIPVPEFQRA